MIKKILTVFGVCFIVLIGDASDFCSEDAIKLTREFFFRLRENRSFSYDEELKFFPKESLYSSAILLQLGYMNEQGKWIKAKPKISFLCELLRLHKDTLLLPESNELCIFAGIPTDYVGNSKCKWVFDAQIAVMQLYKEVNLFRQVTLFYRVPQKKIDFPIYVDGALLADIIGFKITNGIPVLDKNTLDKLTLIEKSVR